MDEAFEDQDPPSEHLREGFLPPLIKLRPKLHRFCSLMCGSVLDGEDLVETTLVAVSTGLPLLGGTDDLELRVFAMAYQRCLEFARQDRGLRENHLRHGAPMGPMPWPTPPLGMELGREVIPFVDALSPRERARVILKGVLGYDWLQVTTIDQSTVGHVKMSLHWGRAKLHSLSPPRHSEPRVAPDMELLRTYARAFNRREVGALDALLSEGVRIENAESGFGQPECDRERYLAEQMELGDEWTLAIARVDGEIVLARERLVDATAAPHSAVRIWANGGRISRIRDYAQIDQILRDARVEPFKEAA